MTDTTTENDNPLGIEDFDVAAYLEDVEDQVALISDALATGDRAYIASAFGTVARARGLTGLAGETGLTRQALHKAFSQNGNPTLATLIELLRALGIRLVAEAEPMEEARAA